MNFPACIATHYELPACIATDLEVEYLAHALQRVVADVEFGERRRPLEAGERSDTVVLEV